MYKLFLSFASILMFGQVFGQTEFETYKNGLIYNDVTMNKLGRIVDSLNLKYKNCDLNKIFYSKSQTIGHVIKVDSINITEALKDLDNNISLEDFLRKYPNATIKRNVLIVKFKYEDYNQKEKIDFNEIDPNTSYGFEMVRTYNESLFNKDFKNTWLYDYNEKTNYSKESLEAFYFPENFTSKPLKDKYSKQIGYADCLIDTTTTKFTKDAKQGWVEFPKNWQILSESKKEKLLKKMRSTRVVGGCSMDSSPRVHAMYIAVLSAETTNWEVFLKSHLDIMNDRFERVSDGSYAYGQRKTYIKELEELDINVLDLLLGTSLRIENPANNHYYGSIGRVGRAITESKDKTAFENEMLAMIEDNELDDYNRMLSYFLYISYNNYLEDKTEQQNNLKKVKNAISKLPDYLKDKIKISDI